MVDASEPHSLSFRFQSHFDSQPDIIILSGYNSFNLSISGYPKTHSACMWPCKEALFSWDGTMYVQDMVFLHLESWAGFFFGIEALKGALNFPWVPLQGGLHLKRNKVSIAAVHVNEQEFRRVSNWGLSCTKAQFRRRTIHELNLMHRIKYKKSLASKSNIL